MRKLFSVLTALLVITLPNISLADSSKECGAIAKACLKAGYSKNEESRKAFWMSCMKPVLLGHAVKGVKVDAKDVQNCKEFKIKKMESELQELKAST